MICCIHCKKIVLNSSKKWWKNMRRKFLEEKKSKTSMFLFSFQIVYILLEIIQHYISFIFFHEIQPKFDVGWEWGCYFVCSNALCIIYTYICFASNSILFNSLRFHFLLFRIYLQDWHIANYYYEGHIFLISKVHMYKLYIIKSKQY